MNEWIYVCTSLCTRTLITFLYALTPARLQYSLLWYTRRKKSIKYWLLIRYITKLCNNIRCTCDAVKFPLLDPWGILWGHLSGRGKPTPLIHLPAVNLETTTISCRKAPETTNHQQLSPWGEGQTSDNVIPYPAVFIRLQTKEMV